MKRTFATLGAVGLAMLSVTAPAYAANDVKICHNGGVLWINIHAADGPTDHAGHPDDIISADDLAPRGLNWNPQGIETYNNNCVPKVVLPPAEEEQPPGEEEQPPGEEEQPPGEEEQPPGEEEQPPGEEEQPPGEEEQPTGEEEQPSVEEEQSTGEVEPTIEVEQSTPVTETPVTLTPAVQTPALQAAAPKSAATKAPATPSKGTNQGFNAQTAAGGTDESTTWLAGLGVLLGAGAVVAVRRKSRTESPTAG